MKSSHNTIGKKNQQNIFWTCSIFCKARLKCKSCAHKQVAKITWKTWKKGWRSVALNIKKILKKYHKLHVGHIY